MTCSGCARSVRDAIQMVRGVDRVQVELETSRAVVQWREGAGATDSEIVAVVGEAGFRATSVSGEKSRDRDNQWSPLAGWKFNVALGSVVTAILMIAEWIFLRGEERWYHWCAFALALPVQALCGARFYRGAWSQLKAGRSNMDTLVALGSTTAFAYSAWGLFAGLPGHLFFMESAAIITLVSVGHWIEAKVSARAESSLRALLNLTPPGAIVLDGAGNQKEVPVAQLRLGDRVLIKPGSRVPIDAEVIEGGSSVDESMLTGESMPVDKAKGTLLFAGTFNLGGLLKARVSATGESTAIAQIIAVVQRAQSSRAKIQKLGDQVSAVFVPFVVLIALGTGLGWFFAPDAAFGISRWLEGFLWPAHHPSNPLAAAFYHAAAVLIIACPCAMGLATPVAIMAGANIASERGILIRDGVALEKSGQITAVVFDKTGTLTQGKVSVAAVSELQDPGPGLGSLRSLAASMASPSTHPLAHAIAGLSNDAIQVLDWEEVRGSGIQATFAISEANPKGLVARLGSLTWLAESAEVLLPDSPFVEDWTSKGATVVGLAVQNRLLGLFALADEVKSNAAAVIASLKRRGRSVYMLTGDNEQTAQSIARLIGLESAHVFAGVRPEKKAEVIKQLQEAGQRVAFVGDGINDAPALEQSDLGIAVSRASDVAREAADIILLKSDIQAIPEAIELARATLRTIKQNLFWAFFYNAAAIPLAVFGFLSPILSALTMGLSDLIVIGNALRLRRWKYRNN